jgi:PAS domain S-box-containing protein
MSQTDTASGECIKVLSVDGHVIHVNTAGLRLLEIDSAHTLGGARYADIWPTETRQRVAKAIRDAVNGHSTAFEGYCPTFAGTPRWWETMFYSDKIRGGSNTVVIGVSRDISLQRAAELADQAARERFALLAGAACDGVLVMGADGRCTYVNPAAASLLGYGATALVGRTLGNVLHGRGQGAPAEFPGHSPLVYAARSGRPACFEYERITHKRGHKISVSVAVHPVSPVRPWCAAVITMAAAHKAEEPVERRFDSSNRPQFLVEIEGARVIERSMLITRD